MANIVEAHCAWGEGPDVLLVQLVDGQKRFTDLNKAQALQLAIDLQKAVAECNLLDSSYGDWIKSQVEGNHA